MRLYIFVYSEYYHRLNENRGSIHLATTVGVLGDGEKIILPIGMNAVWGSAEISIAKVSTVIDDETARY